MGEEGEVGWGEGWGTIREGGTTGGSRGVARGTEGEVGWGSLHHPGLLPQLPVPGPGRGRDQKDNRVRRGATRQTGTELEEGEGGLCEQREVEIEGQA